MTTTHPCVVFLRDHQLALPGGSLQFNAWDRTMTHFILVAAPQGLPANAFVGIYAARTASLRKIDQIDHDLVAT